MKKPSKQATLLKALTSGRTVTHATAMIDYKIPNLTAVIGDLRRAGHRIKCVTDVDVSGNTFSKFIYEV